MQEARLIVPHLDRAGMARPDIRNQVALKLTRTFGGITHWPAQGAWVNQACDTISGKVEIFEVACRGNSGTESLLRNIATWVRRELDQDCVYLRMPSGQVEFI